MAYGQQQNNRPAYSKSGNTTAAVGTGKPALLSTGLFKPEKGKAIGTVKLKEGITIPAGSYINLYEVENRKESSPVFRLQVREAVSKK